jgi:hypothetical protein
MNSDIRLAVSFRGHRKRKRLRLLLGPGSTDFLIDLWIGAAMNHPSGILQGMDETDIALESGWEGEPQSFVTALLECGFLEKAENGAYALHDWEDHQGYVVHAEARKQKARKAAAVRWENTHVVSDAPEMPVAYTGQAASNARAETGNAPSPLPSPSPHPEPVPAPEPVPPPSPAPGSAKQKPPAAFGEESEAYKLAVLMRDTLHANVPTLKEPNLQAWARDFDVALRNDSRMSESHFVAQVIVWACSDSFWRGNIQSPVKLREKFDQLTAKMEAQTRAAPVWQSAAERRVVSNQAACAKARTLLFGREGETVHD